MKKIKKMQVPPTRAEAAADELRRRIVDGVYPGGMQLRQAQIAEELGISRIPFREALVQLEGEGLISTTPHKGAVVVEVSPDDVSEQFAFRALLEPELLLLSGPRLQPSDYEQLHKILQEYSAELRSSNSSRWGELNTELHGLLIGRAGRPRMQAVADQLLHGTDRFTRMQLILTHGRERAEQEHGELVRLCASGEYASAAELLRSHIINAGEALVKVLKEHKAKEDAGPPAPKGAGTRLTNA